MKSEYKIKKVEMPNGHLFFQIDPPEKYAARNVFFKIDLWAYTDLLDAIERVLSGKENRVQFCGIETFFLIKKGKTKITAEKSNSGKGASCKIATRDLRELLRLYAYEERLFKTHTPTLYEQAHYHKILLSCGMDDGYDAWLDTLLASEEVLGGLLSELAFCRSDLNKIISYINLYCPVSATDTETVLAMLRAFWLRKYRENTLSRHELAENMYTCWTLFRELGNDSPDSGYGMSLLIDYCFLAEEGIIKDEVYDQALVCYLETGKKPDFWK